MILALILANQILGLPGTVPDSKGHGVIYFLCHDDTQTLSLHIPNGIKLRHNRKVSSVFMAMETIKNDAFFCT